MPRSLTSYATLRTLAVGCCHDKIRNVNVFVSYYGDKDGHPGLGPETQHTRCLPTDRLDGIEEFCEVVGGMPQVLTDGSSHQRGHGSIMVGLEKGYHMPVFS